MKKYLILFLKILGFLGVFAVLEFFTQPITYFISGLITNDYIVSIIQLILEVGAAFISIKLFIWKGKFNEIGFYRRFDKRLLLKMLLFGLALNLITNIIIFALNGYTFEAFIWDRLYIEDIIGALVIGIISAAGGAIVEEFPMRGYVFNLVNKYSKYAAIVVTALVYIAIHIIYRGIYLPYIVGLLLMSVLLSFIFIITGNIVYNTAFFTGWFYSNTFIFSTVESEALSPGVMFLKITDKYLLNGGSTGIYGSLVFSFLVLLANIYLFNIIRKKGYLNSNSSEK